MSGSTSNLDLLYAGQAGKELSVNALADAASPAVIFGRRASVCSGLVWGYYGGAMSVDGVLSAIANGSVTLSASQTNYLQASRSGSVTSNTSGFSAGQIPLYTIVTGASTVTSYTDNRAWVQPAHITSNASVAVTSADVTLTADQARAEYLATTGVLTGNRAVIVPNNWRGAVYCNNTGSFTTTVKTSGGAGIVVAQTKRAMLYADGANVVRLGPDV